MPVTLESQNCTEIQMLVLTCFWVTKHEIELGAMEFKTAQFFVKDLNDVVYEVQYPHNRTKCKKPGVFTIKKTCD